MITSTIIIVALASIWIAIFAVEHFLINPWRKRIAERIAQLEAEARAECLRELKGGE